MAGEHMRVVGLNLTVLIPTIQKQHNFGFGAGVTQTGITIGKTMSKENGLIEIECPECGANMELERIEPPWNLGTRMSPAYYCFFCRCCDNSEIYTEPEIKGIM